MRRRHSAGKLKGMTETGCYLANRRCVGCYYWAARSRARPWTSFTWFPRPPRASSVWPALGVNLCPSPAPSSARARLHSPLASRQHLALHNLAKHLEAPLQLEGAHVAGEISNTDHSAFALLEKGTQRDPVTVWPLGPLGGRLPWIPRPQSTTPG